METMDEAKVEATKLHRRINDLCRWADDIARVTAADSLDSCCSNYDYCKTRLEDVVAYKLVHKAYALNALADEVEAGRMTFAEAWAVPAETAFSV